jgi:adenosylmethionine-8-amino-7-oxononanoate aminotransferase
VVPDFLCLAKGLTGGYLPLAATLTKEDIYQAFLGRPQEGRTFFHGHTYSGNQLAAAAALANLDVFESSQLLESLPRKAEVLRRGLDRIGQLEHVGEVRQRGLMAGIELVRCRPTKEAFAPSLRVGMRVCRAARDQGVLLRPLGDVIVLMPPLAIDTRLLDRLCNVTCDCIDRVTREIATSEAP